MSITSVWNKILWFCKKYLEADAVQNMIQQKSQNNKQQVLGPCVTFVDLHIYLALSKKLSKTNLSWTNQF